VVLVSSLVGMIPRASKFLPTLLMDGNSLIYSQKSPEDYTAALLITTLTAVAALAIGLDRFNKKQL
jgi:ABC-2 type transport system permease protein